MATAQNQESVSAKVPFSPGSDLDAPGVGYLAEWNRSAEHV